MRHRFVFVAGLGFGFVLGARAGRERYEQLRRLARKAADNPAVQQASDAVQAQAADLARSAREKLSDRAGTTRAKAGDALRERVPGMKARDSNGHTSHPGTERFDPATGVPRDPQDT